MSVHPSLDTTTLPLDTLFRLLEERGDLLAAQVKLTEENASLKEQLAEIQRRVEAMESIRLHSGQNFPHPSTALTKSPSESSVSPSDSVSQRGCEDSHSVAPAAVPHLAERPTERPSDFSPKVLWTLQECRRDSTAHKGNRINLSAAIRDKDGNAVSYIKVIKTTARIHFISSMASLPIPLNAPKHQTGLWWKTYRPNEWTAALHHLEVSHPVVAYCASHWKAEEIFRVVIQTRLDSERASQGLRKVLQQALQIPTDGPGVLLEQPPLALTLPVPTPEGLSEQSVQNLEIDELKELIRVQGILVSVVKPKKGDYISAILTAPDEKRLTDAHIESIIEKRAVITEKATCGSQKS